MKKSFFLLGLVVVVGMVFIGRQQLSNTSPSQGEILSPKQQQVFSQGQNNLISWKTPAGKTAPFVIVYIQTVDGKVFGTIDSQTTGTALNWKANQYFQGDAGLPLLKGNYKIKIVGYNSDFCYNGECAPGSKTTAVVVYELNSDVFVVQ